jgi:hypothetical protein
MDDLHLFLNGRRAQFFGKLKTTLIFWKVKDNINFLKMEDDLIFSKEGWPKAKVEPKTIKIKTMVNLVDLNLCCICFPSTSPLY